MKTNVYLIFTKNGSVESRMTKPKLSSGQVAVKLNIDLSDTFFDRFVPEATLSIKDSDVIKPEITVEVPDRVMESLIK